MGMGSIQQGGPGSGKRPENAPGKGTYWCGMRTRLPLSARDRAMRLFARLRQPLIVFLHDLVMVPVAWLGAFWLRFNLGEIPPEFQAGALRSLPLLLVVQAVVFWRFGLYRGVWRFASLPDILRILKAVVVGATLCFTLLFAWNRLAGVPRSIPVLYTLLLFVLLGGARFFYRWLKDHKLNLGGGPRVLIVGAGRAGDMLARDLERETDAGGYQVVGFVDDNPRRWGAELRGVRVLGGCDALPRLVTDLAIDLIILAIPSASVREMRRVVEQAEKTGLPIRTVPRLSKLLRGKVRISELRDVLIEDLLGREPIELDDGAINRCLRDKRILVTGGGGSIGSELCRQIARRGPRALIVFELSEHKLYEIEMELRRRWPGLNLVLILGDVRDEVLVDRVMVTQQPDVIFHAAAYKHVPMLERQVRAAVANNVLGTRCVARSASRHGVGRFVLISTDKAVNPANVMGMTKRVAELYCQNRNARSRTRFITVRFGNVLGSAGSVVPLFRRQIEAGGPVTVTDPEIERYFMTIPEACLLIMQASALGDGGEIFVLDMGEPVRIRYLAEQMIRLSGRVPGEDIEIVYTGLREGEKLYEELFHPREKLVETGHDKLLLARSRVTDWERLERGLDALEQAVAADDEKALLALLEQWVPERHPAHRQGEPAA